MKYQKTKEQLLAELAEAIEKNEYLQSLFNKIEAAKDLGLRLEDFKSFWMVYRNGVQHQGIPRKCVDKNEVKYSWQISDDFDAIPQVNRINAYKRDVRLNVWKFADLIINKFKTNPEVFQKATSKIFAEVK